MALKKTDGRCVVQLFNHCIKIHHGGDLVTDVGNVPLELFRSRVQTRGWTAFSFRARNAAASGPFSQAFIGRTAHHRSWWRCRTQSSRVCGKLPVSSFLSVAGACGGPIHPNQNIPKSFEKQVIDQPKHTKTTLWLCQNSYWKWPSRNRRFSHERMPCSYFQ